MAGTKDDLLAFHLVVSMADLTADPTVVRMADRLAASMEHSTAQMMAHHSVVLKAALTAANSDVQMAGSSVVRLADLSADYLVGLRAGLMDF